jgi:hypothetical protein
MKKMLLVIIATGSILFASAQIQFGVKAGYNLTTLTTSASSDLKSKSGFSGGVLASVPLFNTFYLQPEIVYSGQGTSFTVGGVNANLNYNYLNVPVLFKYQNPKGFFAETGPQVGFVLSANIKANGMTTDVKDEIQTMDFSWAFGLGYLIPDVNLGIDVRYNLGITNTAKDSGGETEKNSVFQFGLFYMFGGK